MDRYPIPSPMTKPAVISVIFHALVVALFVLGLPFFGRQYLAPKPQFTVNLVLEGAHNPNANAVTPTENSATATNVTPSPAVPMPILPTPLPPVPIQAAALPPPPPPNATPVAKIPVPEAANTPPAKVTSRQDLLRQLAKAVDKDKASPSDDKAKAKEKEKSNPSPAAPPIATPTPAAKPDPLAELMQAMDRSKLSSESPLKKKPASKAASNGNMVNNKVANPAASQALGIIDLDAVRRAVEPCWHVDAGMLNASQLLVDLRLTINHDGVVERAEIVDTARYKTDRYFRAAADAARRAIENPNCRSLPLPMDRYDDWHISLFTFDPKNIGR